MATDIDFRARRVDVRAVPGNEITFTVVLEDLGFVAAPTVAATFGAITATSSATYDATSGNVTITVTLSAVQTTALATTPVAWTLVVTPSGGAPRTFLGGTYEGDADPTRSTPRAAHRIRPYDSAGTLTLTGGTSVEINNYGVGVAPSLVEVVTSLPAATESLRGLIRILQAAGVPDKVYMCERLANANYDWVEI